MDPTAGCARERQVARDQDLLRFGGAAPVAVPSGTRSGSALQVTARGIAFSPTSLSAPASAPFTISFVNQDGGVRHNVAIYSNSTATQTLFRGQIFTGPKTVVYHVSGLPPGTYYFQCDLHPGPMHGTFVVH